MGLRSIEFLKPYGEYLTNPLESKKCQNVSCPQCVRCSAIVVLIQQAQTAFDNNAQVKEAIGKPFEIQRLLLNRFFIFQLVNLNQNTEDARYALIETGTAKQWLALVSGNVIPVFIENNLPK